MEEIVEEMCRMGSNADEIVATEARRSKLEDEVQRLTLEWEELAEKYDVD